MAATVTIDKAYFETLLRRAEFHSSGRDLSTPVNIPTVCIPKIDHDNLLRMAQEYSSLRDSLYRGGITPDTLEILIRGENPPCPALSINGDEAEDGGASIFSRPQKSHMKILQDTDSIDSGFRRAPRKSWAEDSDTPKAKPGFFRQSSSALDDGSFTPDIEKEDGFLTPSKQDRPFYARADQRTILVKGLSDKTTHRDLVNVIRGGTVLDIYLRSNERSASISFVEGLAASDFMNHAKRNDIYVNGKRVEAGWNDRQFILPGHVANKIGIGATRNLVIRGVHPNITEERLREDLDHIHNLVIISIVFKKGDAFIELNSIHNSLFARTCMMSRATYKGMKIEWYPDECAQPLPKMQNHLKKENQRLRQIQKPTAAINRFQMLGIDGSEDGSSGEEEPTVSSDFSPLRIGARSPWNPGSVAA